MSLTKKTNVFTRAGIKKTEKYIVKITQFLGFIRVQSLKTTVSLILGGFMFRSTCENKFKPISNFELFLIKNLDLNNSFSLKSDFLDLGKNQTK